MAEAGTCNTDKPEIKTPTTTDELLKIFEDFKKEANSDANKTPDASPWTLVHLSGMRKMLKAFHALRELAVREVTQKSITSDMTIDQKNKAESEAIKIVDNLIDEEMR